MDTNQELLINIKQATTRCPEELANILKFDVDDLIMATDALFGPTIDDLKHKLVQAKLFNEKLLDNSLGADSAIHQVIDENLEFVLKYLD
ncbi:MAG: hypothetical protein HRT37_06280 [Alteromonadaceae bacterium]|nr:hypothetical protein [Alteromonadaceae bacterium]